MAHIYCCVLSGSYCVNIAGTHIVIIQQEHVEVSVCYTTLGFCFLMLNSTGIY